MQFRTLFDSINILRNRKEEQTAAQNKHQHYGENAIIRHASQLCSKTEKRRTDHSRELTENIGIKLR